MSVKVDNERKEATREARLAAAKERYDMQLVVITGHVEGVSKAEIVRRLKARFGRGCAQTVWGIEVFLGLLSGKQHRGRTGARKTRRAIEELQP